jgi:ABC-type bacteriocin/lantibiotic exporter with double-glycine peptidase domain
MFGERLKRRLLIPEIVQTSMMDCGPASLKAMLEGWGIPVSYGRLREACQTDVDGTSIDTMEEVSAQLGLDAEQVMLPPDHLLLSSAQALPAIVVVRHPSGVTHFLIAWRMHGPLIQVMDPAIGRRWITRRRFLKELYIHTMPVAASGWREWAASEQFLGALQKRLDELNISRGVCARLRGTALADEGWRSIAALDAATRLVAVITRSGGISRGAQATRALELFFQKGCDDSPEEALAIPSSYWSVRPAPPDSESDEEQVLLRGAVLVRVRGTRPRRALQAAEEHDADDEQQPLAPELVAALEERPVKPMRALLGMFLADGVLSAPVLLCAVALAAAGVIIEALLLRGLLDVGRDLMLSRQRLEATGFLLLFLSGLLLLDIPVAATALRLGRQLELRLRIAFLEKLPRLSDSYFHSRLTSDMAERSHSIHRIRTWPEMGSQFLRVIFTLIFTVAALAWLSPSSTLLVVLAATCAIAVPLISNPVLSERDLRVRTHAGALSRFYLDAFQGLIPIRTHSAEKAVRREHESLLVEWTRASLSLQKGAVAVEAVQMVTGFGLAALLSYSYLKGEGQIGGALLLIYWSLSLPVLGQEIAGLARLYPAYRNVALRLLEPLGAIEEVAGNEQDNSLTPSLAEAAPGGGVHIDLREVSVRAGGHIILDEINLVIESGSHVAIVGSSGAGKSSLVGLLLGWHKPTAGVVLVDGLPLEGKRFEDLRLQTAWVDPSVQLWNRSLMDNLRYGTRDEALFSTGEVVEAADLGAVLERLPDGLQTSLGEGGALVSGGEGQRVRLGRALLRPCVRLAILDEPFRGLDRERRRELLMRAREHWTGATLLCITHDVGETLSFERALVVEGGRVVEDGVPAELAAQPDSRYRSLLEAEAEVREKLWAGVDWRRLRIEKGHLSETPRSEEA